MAVHVITLSCPFPQGNSSRVNSIDDKRDFEQVLAALKVIDFTDDESKSIWSILAAILHLGNITFEKTEQGNAVIQHGSEVEHISKVSYRSFIQRGYYRSRSNLIQNKIRMPQSNVDRKPSMQWEEKGDVKGVVISIDASNKRLYVEEATEM